MFSSVLNFISVFVCFLTIVNFASTEDVPKLKVQVYYESKCPDSAEFFRNQLYPTMIGRGRLTYTDLELIPFGKAFTYKNPKNNQLAAECQHGEAECLDNALHACILETNDFRKAFEAISCLMASYRRELEICHTSTKFNLSVVDDCLADRSTAQILQPYENKTNQIPLSFVPSIALNGVFNENEQNQLLRRFDRTFCRTYKATFGKQLPECN